MNQNVKRDKSLTRIISKIINPRIDYHSMVIVGTGLMARSKDSWIVDSSASVHICNIVQGFHQTISISEGDSRIHMGSHVKERVWAVGDVIIKLST